MRDRSPDEYFENILTPRGADHGWWNCKGCRERFHNLNFVSINLGYYHDMCGHFFTDDYVKDMEMYYVELEEFDKACVVRDFRKCFIGTDDSLVY